MGPTPEPEIFSAILEVTGGKSATFEPIDKKIVVKPFQKRNSNLTVYKMPNTTGRSVFIAFCFEMNQNKYVLGVKEQKICFEIQAQIKPKAFSNKFLFTWARNKGQYGSLCSVADPDQYLYVNDQEVILSRKPDNCFKVNLLQQTTMNIISFVQSSTIINSGLVYDTKNCVCSLEPLKLKRKRSHKKYLFF